MYKREFSRRFKRILKLSGLTHQEIAKELDLNVPSIYDMADRDEIMGYPANEIFKLLKLLKINPVQAFADDPSETFEPFSLEQLNEAIRTYIREHGAQLSDLEDDVGWELEDLLNDNSRWFQRAIACLEDVSKFLGINWIRVLTYMFNDYESGRLNYKEEKGQPAS